MTPDRPPTAWAKLTPELLVSDLAVSLAFYVDVLGFSICYGRPEEGFAYLEKEGAQLMLEAIDPDARQWTIASLERPFGRGMNLQIEVAAVEDLHAELERRGISLFLALEDKWYRVGPLLSGNRQLIVADPDGYLLRFFSHLGERPAG
ncbi:bleomycin resistance protein [Mongoliimonas terrestris]|uniref:bleomycin resistance protein n=1 Tax=Mongoliimonas terrestris TaxID=1709001 RepID=UPI00094974C9|nr:VOC family protein [Mongoliimonas terrestris]